MRISEFTYDLPDELIAQSPLEDRAASRLLVLDKAGGATRHFQFRDLPDLLRPGDLLVLNDTRVTALRIFGSRPTGGTVEALLLQDNGDGSYVALVRPARKLSPGELVSFDGGLSALVAKDLGEGRRLLQFQQEDYRSRLARVGLVPLPPYVRSPIADPERYQTVYASCPGSAAAPTAGLHFMPDLFDRLRDRGIQTASVSLDVSLDTFRPIGTDDVEDHKMHGERCTVPESTARAVGECRGRVVAVGTTTVRTLETFATGRRSVEPGEANSKLFIRPGHDFQVVDAMVTNFHLPGTTMLLLVAALAGTSAVLDAYREAVERGYRFLSFGDSMLVL